MKYVFMIIPALFLIASVLLTMRAVKKGAKAKNALKAQILSFLCVCVICVAAPMIASAASDNNANAETATTSATAQAPEQGIGFGLGLLAAGIVTSCSCIAGGRAVASAAPAAIAASSENPKLFTKSLILVALCEGLPLYGVLISIFILAKV